MIISEEQVRLAVEYLHTQDPQRDTSIRLHADEETAEILDRVMTVLNGVPDIRDDRIAEARELLHGSMPTPTVVADKLIGRVISDSIR